MRVLVTGGAGFIGHHLVRSMLSAEHEVVVLDNSRRGSFERAGLAGAELLPGDIRDPACCKLGARGCDAVVHLAAQSNVMGSEADPGYTFETNVYGTWNVARAAAESDVRVLIFASSREVYGDPDQLPVAEHLTLRPKNAYGASKVAAEGLLTCGAAGKASARVLRFANVIGSGDAGRVMPNWLHAARQSLPLAVFGGAQILDFVPVATAVRAIESALELEEWDGPVNVGSGVGTRLLELAKLILERHPGTGSSLQMTPARDAEVTRFIADISRMRSVLGVEPPTNPLAAVPGSSDEPW